MEKDDELKGEGNSYDFGERMLDPRIGRFFGTDPIIQPWESPYSYAANNPIYFIDANGENNIVYLVILPSAREKLGKKGMEAIRKEMEQRLRDLGLVTEVYIFEDGGAEFDSRNIDKSDSFVVLGSLKEIKKEVKGSPRYADLNYSPGSDDPSAIDTFTGVSGNPNIINPENSANKTSDDDVKAGRIKFASGVLVDLEALADKGTVEYQLQTNKENRFSYFAIHGLSHNAGLPHNSDPKKGGYLNAEYEKIAGSIGAKTKLISAIKNIQDVFKTISNTGFISGLKKRLDDNKDVKPERHYSKRKKERAAAANKRS